MTNTKNTEKKSLVSLFRKLDMSSDPLSPDFNHHWDELIEAHQITKETHLKAEEFDSSLKTWVQPINELRNSHDHLIRVITAIRENDPLDQNHLKYIEDNFHAALSHEFRAFFDVADALSIGLREKIHETMSQFKALAISNALPGWYPTTKPRIEAINGLIADAREKKDVGSNEKLPLMREHLETINELHGIWLEILKALPSLVEITTEMSESERQWKRFSIWMMVLGVLLGGILTVVVTYFFMR